MKSFSLLFILWWFSVAGGASSQSPKPTRPSDSAAAESLAIIDPWNGRLQHERSITVTAHSLYFLIAKIADAKHRSIPDLEGEDPFEGPTARKNANKTLFYLYLPTSASEMKVSHSTKGRTTVLPLPRKVFRHRGSPLYIPFLLAPSAPGKLSFRSGNKVETVDLANSAGLFTLPFFWSGEPPSVANEELPAWLKGTGQ